MGPHPTPLQLISHDTVVISPQADTARRFLLPPSRWRTAEQYRTENLLAGPFWPLPPVDQIAAGDLADWLAFHPVYDVDDAPGVGQTRYFTHWGLVDRVGGWRVDGHTVAWQRLAFPMTAEYGPGILPDFDYADAHAGAGVILRGDTAWGDRPVFDYTFRQGDYSDTHSEGFFRAHTRGGFGLDLSGRFFSSQGRYTVDDRDLRNLRLETFGPYGTGNEALAAALGLELEGSSHFPDAYSFGYVLYGKLDYESVIGALSLSPHLAWTHDVRPSGSLSMSMMTAAVPTG